MSDEGQYCAHLKVEWFTRDIGDGQKEGLWRCCMCHIPFTPTASSSLDEAAQMERKRIILAIGELPKDDEETDYIAGAITVIQKLGPLSTYLAERDREQFNAGVEAAWESTPPPLDTESSEFVKGYNEALFKCNRGIIVLKRPPAEPELPNAK